MGEKMEVVHGAKNKPEKVYRRRAKNKPLMRVKRVLKGK